MFQKKCIVLSLVWMIIIFAFSARTADESSQMSKGVGAAIGQFFVTDYESWSEEEQDSFIERIEHPIRKSAHMLEYALLGFLLMGALGGKKRASAITGVLYAISDEFHQLFVLGRSGQFTDVLIDSAGIILGIIIFGFLWRIICEKRKA